MTGCCSGMTGFGNASGQNDRFSASVEIKAVNNRYLKVSQKFPEVLAPLEPQIEKAVRSAVARGTVTLTIQFCTDRSDIPVSNCAGSSRGVLAAASVGPQKQPCPGPGLV